MFLLNKITVDRFFKHGYLTSFSIVPPSSSLCNVIPKSKPPENDCFYKAANSPGASVISKNLKINNASIYNNALVVVKLRGRITKGKKENER